MTPKQTAPSLAALASALPEVAWPNVPRVPWGTIHDRWPLLRDSCEAAATSLARGALGLPIAVVLDTGEITASPPFGALDALARHTGLSYLANDDIIARIAKAHSEIYMVFGPGWHERGGPHASERWTAMMALVVGAFGEWDLVAAMTGGPLPATVAKDLALGDNFALIVRHLAVVARMRATKYAATTLRELRARIVRALATTKPEALTDASFELRFALIAARIYFTYAVQVHDTAEAVRAWLAGGELEHEAPPRPMIAGGADVRATIFERYLPELSDPQQLATATRTIGAPVPQESADSAAILLHVANEPKPEGWAKHVDPLVASLLGAPIDPELRAASIEALRRRARRFRSPSAAVLAGPVNLAHALIGHDDSAVLVMTGRGSLAPFTPGQLFGDDFRLLGRYLLAARKANAAVDDVRPAWLDFLARRSPGTSRILLTWRCLLLFQSILTTELGGLPEAITGDALRIAITRAG